MKKYLSQAQEEYLKLVTVQDWQARGLNLEERLGQALKGKLLQNAVQDWS